MTHPTRYYARFADGMSSILTGAATLTLGAILATLVTAIYAVAYVFPLVGAGILLWGGYALLTGDVGAAVSCALGGILFVGFGSVSYHEWFVGDVGTMLPITEVPAWVVGAAENVREEYLG